MPSSSVSQRPNQSSDSLRNVTATPSAVRHPNRSSNSSSETPRPPPGLNGPGSCSQYSAMTGISRIGTSGVWASATPGTASINAIIPAASVFRSLVGVGEAGMAHPSSRQRSVRT